MVPESALRTFAIELVSYACGRWTGGRDEEDAVYLEVTEHRDVGPARKSYSSCGDLAHWMLYRLGCRSEFINRQEHRGWKSGKNVSLLAFSPLALSATSSDQYLAGDVLIIWSKADGTDAHVMVALEHQGERLLSGEYGQPGGAVREHVLTRPGWVGQRKIQKVLRLLSVMQDAEARAELLEPDYTVLPQALAYATEYAR